VEASQKDGKVSHKLHFIDRPNRLSVGSAKAHVKRLEAVMKSAPHFVKQVNEALNAANNLYGKPIESKKSRLYSKVAAPEKVTAPRKGVAKEFEVFDKGDYYFIAEKGNAARRGDSNPTVVTDEAGNPHVMINLHTHTGSKVEHFKQRIENLRDSIATAEAMLEEAKKLPKK
jgi:hypothetical protein